jgi:hypothetical protein
VILHPTAKAKKQQVMFLFKAGAEFFENLLGRLRPLAMAQQPAQIQQQINFFAAHRTVIPKEGVDYFLAAIFAAGLRIA